MGNRYWLKLQRNFFDDENILFLESQKNGLQYIILWQKLLLRCLKDGEEDAGFLRFNEKIPYTEELISTVTKTDIDTVRVGMKYFQDLGMIEILEDGTLYIEAVQKLIGKESESAERVRKHREKKKMLQSNGVTVTCNDNKEEEVYIEVEEEKIKRERKKNPSPPKHKHGRYKRVLLTDDEYQKVQDEDLNVYLENLDEYIEMKGDKYKSHIATMRAWKRKDEPKAQPKKVDYAEGW